MKLLKNYGVLKMKKPITVLVTEEQYDKIQEKKQETGNSQNSIIRDALNKYLGKGADKLE